MIINPKYEDIVLPDIVGLDIETTGLKAWEDNILAIALNTGDSIYVLETRLYTQDQLIDLFTRLSSRKVIGHNLKFECCFIYYHYKVVLKNIWDTQLAAQLLFAGIKKFKKEGYGLLEVTRKFLGIQEIDSQYKEILQKSFIGRNPSLALTSDQLDYAASDVVHLIKLYQRQLLATEEAGLSIIVNLENRLVSVLAKMEVVGCKIDVKGWRNAIKLWEKKVYECELLLDEELRTLSQTYPILKGKYSRLRKKEVVEVLDIFGNSTRISNKNVGNINYGSSDQILEIFKLLELPIPSETVVENGEEVIKESCGEEVIRTYLTEYPRTPLRPFIELLLKYREFNKLVSTYGESFLAKLDSNGYIHTEYSQCFTDTGRISSKNPNLQNIPSSDLEKDGYDIRMFFIPDDGTLFVTSDMSNAEARIAADFSKDPELMDAFIKGKDIHSELASISYSLIFGKEVTITNTEDIIEVKKDKYKASKLRKVHKSVLFAKFYKGGAKRVYEVLAEYINLYCKSPMTVAKKISNSIDEKLQVLSVYLSNLIQEANVTKVLRANEWGRLRHFEKNAYGNAANFPIQATNADAMKCALILADEYFEKTGYGRCVLTVHDELTSSVVKNLAEEVKEEIQKILTKSLQQFLEDVPAESSANIAEYWEK